ncbi:MAG: hypothetical protein AB9819_04700 [Methanomassiliicoccales archaeon]
MYKFQTAQRELSIGGVKVGGQPGKRRTMLVGSLFYPRHSVVLDPRQGTLDKAKLNERLDSYLGTISNCGCPSGLMLYAESCGSARAYLEAVCDKVPGPLFADSGSAEVRLSFLKSAQEMGILDRLVYNTINAGLSTEETEALKACPPVNASDPGLQSPRGRRQGKDIHAGERGRPRPEGTGPGGGGTGDKEPADRHRRDLS